MPRLKKDWSIRTRWSQYAAFLVVLLIWIGHQKNVSRIRQVAHLIQEDISDTSLLRRNNSNSSSYNNQHWQHLLQRPSDNDFIQINESSKILPHKQMIGNIGQDQAPQQLLTDPAPTRQTSSITATAPTATSSPSLLAPTLMPSKAPYTASPSFSTATINPTPNPSVSIVTTSPSATPSASIVKAILTNAPSSSNPTTFDPNQLQLIQPPPKFFMGIFTTCIKGHRRRKMIRHALNMYNDSRVCQFGAFDRQKPTKLPTLDDHCQLMYTFVVGANPDGPLEIVPQNRNVPMLAIPSQELRLEADEYKDMTFLRIREHPSNQGKSRTWLNYASQIAKAYGWDYIIKCDAKTHLHIDAFFKFNSNDDDITDGLFHHQHWPRGAQNLYSGLVHWSYPDSHILMSGAFYIVSRDLAERVSKLSMDERQGRPGSRKRRDGFADDVDTGFAIMLNHDIVHVVAISNEQAELLWKYPLLTWEDVEQYTKRIADRLVTGNSNPPESVDSGVQEQPSSHVHTVTVNDTVTIRQTK